MYLERSFSFSTCIAFTSCSSLVRKAGEAAEDLEGSWDLQRSGRQRCQPGLVRVGEDAPALGEGELVGVGEVRLPWGGEPAAAVCWVPLRRTSGRETD